MIGIGYVLFEQGQLAVRLKRQYFLRFWSYVDIGIIVCSWTAVVMYIWRYHESKRIGELFRQTNGYVYIDVQWTAYVNNVYTCLLGCCCFLNTIRFVSLCQYHQRLSLFIRTLDHAAKELVCFAMMFSVIFLAFQSLFHLLFISKISQCATLMQTAQMLFEMSLMKFDGSQLIVSAPFLGPFSFSLFILIMVFICLNIFVSIINDSFHRAQKDIDRAQPVISLMWKKFLRRTSTEKGLPIDPFVAWCIALLSI
jgi:hypothetical protein